jgi:ORF6N domain-containing protein
MTQETVAPKLYTVRGEPVVLDSHLALLYGVETRVFNQAIRRNQYRFPADFAFPLNQEEWSFLRSQIVTLKQGRGRHRKYLPWVFTEHGAIMAAPVLNSQRAVAMSVYVVRAFVKMRRELLADSALEARLKKIEKTLLTHDTALRDVYQKLKPLLLPPSEKPRRRIGFHTE